MHFSTPFVLLALMGAHTVSARPAGAAAESELSSEYGPPIKRSFLGMGKNDTQKMEKYLYPNLRYRAGNPVTYDGQQGECPQPRLEPKMSIYTPGEVDNMGRLEHGDPTTPVGFNAIWRYPGLKATSVKPMTAEQRERAEHYGDISTNTTSRCRFDFIVERPKGWQFAIPQFVLEGSTQNPRNKVANGLLSVSPKQVAPNASFDITRRFMYKLTYHRVGSYESHDAGYQHVLAERSLVPDEGPIEWSDCNPETTISMEEAIKMTTPGKTNEATLENVGFFLKWRKCSKS